MAVLRRLLIPIAIVLTGCGKEPRPIQYGIDACSYCRMTIIDKQYGAEIVTEKGKVHVFDSIECMAANDIKNGTNGQAIAGRYVVPLESEGKHLLNIENATLIVTEKLPSPMGLNISAVGDQKTGEDIALMYHGQVKTWPEIMEYVKARWF